MKITKTKLLKIIKEEVTEVMGDMRAEVPVSTSAKDAMRASGGDDKALRKAIGDFIAMGRPNDVAELAQAIDDYQYSDPYLVGVARDLLAAKIGRQAAAGRAEREKLAQQINERLDIIQEELEKVLDEKTETPDGDLIRFLRRGKPLPPMGHEVTDLPPEAMEELSQLMNQPKIKKIKDTTRRTIIMNHFVKWLKNKYDIQ